MLYRGRFGRAGAASPGPPWTRRVGVVAGTMMVGGAAWNTGMVIARPGAYAGMGDWFQEISPWDLGPVVTARAARR